MTLRADRLLRIPGAMAITAELFLPEIENIDPPVSVAQPQHAIPILVDRKNRVVVEAQRVGLIVLKQVRQAFCSPIEVMQAQARRYP